MEENVALDTTKQRKFVKSIKGIKKLIKKNEVEKSDETTSPKPKGEKKKSNRPERGLVYLSHIPHGFYEHEMTQYFKQFGVVTNVRVIRSKHTGNSKGFAFVEFKEPTVAEIVAETMNNYLMGKRLIKAACIPPEKQRPKAMRKHWSRLNNPGKNARLKMKKAYNESKDEKGELKRARKILSNINKTKKKLSELGINYDFFAPVDVPEALQDSIKKENEDNIEVKENTVKVENKSKKDKKAPVVVIKNTKETLEKNKAKFESKVKPEQAKAKNEVLKTSDKIEEKKPNKSRKDNKKIVEIQDSVVNKKVQKQKQQKLKDAGVNPPENFIKVQDESQDSDSSLEFDSDEYEKMLEDESGEESDDYRSDADDFEEAGSNDDDDDDEDESGEEEENIIPTPKKKVKSVPVLAQQKQVPEQHKRKASQKLPVATKKPKFEKHTQQSMKKQFKKKK